MTLGEVLLLFIAALLSNAIPFVGISYTAIAASILAMEGVRPIELLETSFIISTAAAIGKTFVYALGYGFRRHLDNSPFLSLMARLKQRSIWLIVALTSFIPGLPIDDYVLIALGALRADLTRICLFVFIGKFFKSIIELPVGAFALGPLVGPLGESLGRIWTSLVIGIAASALAYPIYKIDWIGLFKRLFKSKGGDGVRASADT